MYCKNIIQSLFKFSLQEYYPYVISAIQFFLLAAFSMQLCLGLTVYMEFIEMKGVRYPELKLATMGWGEYLFVFFKLCFNAKYYSIFFNFRNALYEKRKYALGA